MESLKHRYTAVPGSHEGGAAPGPEQPSLAPVYTAVAVAGLGAFSFGYHLGIVNGPLAALAADLGFGGNASLQGLVRRPLPSLPLLLPGYIRRGDGGGAVCWARLVVEQSDVPAEP